MTQDKKNINDHQGGTGDHADAKSDTDFSRGVLWRFLDKIEDLLIRMIFGAVKFIFYRLPKFVIDSLLKMFPTAVKLARVCLLLAVWLFILVGPLFFLFKDVLQEHWLSAGGFSVHHLAEDILTAANDKFTADPSSLIWAMWLPLVVVGSLWGLWYIQWRNRRIGKWLEGIAERARRRTPVS